MKWFAMLLIYLLCFSACKSTYVEAVEPNKPIIIASVPPLAGLAKELLGDRTTIESLLPPASNPTTFEPSLSQMAMFESADIVLRIGHHHFPMEQTWLTESRSAEGSRTVVNCVNGGAGEDPHIWWDPTLATQCLSQLAETWIQLYPADREAISQKLESLTDTIATLDQKNLEKLKPFEGRTFLVFHPAWGHFANRYKLNQLAVEAHGHEGNVASITEVIDEAKRLGLKTIYTQPQFSDKSSRLIAEALNLRRVKLDPLGSNWRADFEEAADILLAGFLLENQALTSKR